MLSAERAKKEEEDRKKALLASYYVLDSWAGRLENGLGKNSQGSPVIFTAFKVQTSEVWTWVNLSAIFCQSVLVLLRHCVLVNVLSLLCVIIYIVDIILKMSYMGAKTYWSKPWQRNYILLVCGLFVEAVVSLFVEHGFYAAYSVRPMILVFRERTVRRFFTVVHTMGPGFLEVCFPLVFFLILVSSLVYSWYEVTVPDQFKSVGTALYSLWLLVSTGDTYTALLPPVVQTFPFYMAIFFTILIVGRIFLLSMLMAVTYDVFLDNTRDQVKSERVKELNGLFKAFTILDDEETGKIGMKQFDVFLQCLKPLLSAPERRLYFELASLNSHQSDTVDVIDFLNLKEVLTYQFKFPERENSSLASSITAVPSVFISCATTIVNHKNYELALVAATTADLLFLLLHDKMFEVDLANLSFVILIMDLVLRIAQKGSFLQFFKISSTHEQICFFAMFAHITLSLVHLTDRFDFIQIHRETILKVAHLFRITRCWRLLGLYKNLGRYFECFFGLIPVLIQTLSFALVIAYFFAMIGLQMYGGKVDYFQDTKSAILTMVQIFFGADYGGVIESCAPLWYTNIGIIFFTTYFVIGVIIVFNLINAIIITVYSQTMDTASQDSIQKEEAEVLLLQDELVQRLRKKKVVSAFNKHSSMNPIPLQFTMSKMKPDLGGSNMRRKLTGHSKMSITKDEVKNVKKFQKKKTKKYTKIDIEKVYTEKVEGADGAKNFEKKLFGLVCESSNDFKRQTFQPLDTIVGMGEIQQQFYFVFEGQVQCLYKQKEVKMFEKGNMFGEDMLLSGLPHAYDCVAVQENTIVIAVNRKDFLEKFDFSMQGMFANKVIRNLNDTAELVRKLNTQEFTDNFKERRRQKSSKVLSASLSNSDTPRETNPENTTSKVPLNDLKISTLVNKVDDWNEMDHKEVRELISGEELNEMAHQNFAFELLMASQRNSGKFGTENLSPKKVETS